MCRHLHSDPNITSIFPPDHKNTASTRFVHLTRVVMVTLLVLLAALFVTGTELASGATIPQYLTPLNQEASIVAHGGRQADTTLPLTPEGSSPADSADIPTPDQTAQHVAEDLKDARTTLSAGPVTPRGWPVEGWISSYYGLRRSPTSGSAQQHTGIDIVAPEGASIVATASGRVVTAGWSTLGYGYHVVLEHDGGFSTLYAHMSQVLVQVGDAVTAGDGLGRVGSTGNSTGPHLHYEVWQDGVTLDPHAFLP